MFIKGCGYYPRVLKGFGSHSRVFNGIQMFFEHVFCDSDVIPAFIKGFGCSLRVQ